MNLPNKITLFRFFLSILFVVFYSISNLPYSKTLGFLIFIIASVTDFLDGYIARKYNMVTSFGKLMDPLVDKILISSGLILILSYNLIPAWVVILILGREFFVTGLRLISLSDNVVLSADSLGKYKTTIQIITIIYFLLYLVSKEISLSFLSMFFSIKYMGECLIFLSLVITIFSGLNYIFKNKNLFSSS